MKHTLDIRDRDVGWFGFRTEKNCFYGSDAVDWMLENEIARSEDEAVRIGNRLILCNVMHHVAHAHVLKNENFLYRFVDPPKK